VNDYNPPAKAEWKWKIQNPESELGETHSCYNPNTQIHDPSFSGLGTGTLIKSGGVKLVSWT